MEIFRRKGVIKIGVDIHTYIVKDKKILAKNLYEGRNSEWFANLRGEGYDDEYDRLETHYGISPQAPDSIQFSFDEEHKIYPFTESSLSKIGFYGFYYIKIEDFIDWFVEYRPDKKAGWGTTWEKWAIENKRYIPEYLSHEKDPDSCDQIFIEYFDDYEPSVQIYNYLINKDIPEDADFVFFFDC